MDRSVIYGVNPVIEALQSDIEIQSVYVAVGLRAGTRKEIEKAARKRNLRVLRAPRDELDGMAEGGVHQGVVAVCEGSRYVELDALLAIEKKPRTVVLCLDGIQDPRNLGALARTALAFDVAGIIIPSRRAAPVTSTAVKASAGALAMLPVTRVTNMASTLKKLKDNGFWVCGAVMEEAQAPWEFDPGDKVALVMGAEGTGVRRGIEDLLDFRVRIPMDPRSESLNVSVAGALLLYEWLGRKK